jgi:hypothetical protein
VLVQVLNVLLLLLELLLDCLEPGDPSAPSFIFSRVPLPTWRVWNVCMYVIGNWSRKRTWRALLDECTAPQTQTRAW